MDRETNHAFNFEGVFGGPVAAWAPKKVDSSKIRFTEDHLKKSKIIGAVTMEISRVLKPRAHGGPPPKTPKK